MEKGERSVVESGTQCQRQLRPEPRPSVPITEDYNTESDVKPPSPLQKKTFSWLLHL
jgi:hypothetical protein